MHPGRNIQLPFSDATIMPPLSPPRPEIAFYKLTVFSSSRNVTREGAAALWPDRCRAPERQRVVTNKNALRRPKGVCHLIASLSPMGHHLYRR